MSSTIIRHKGKKYSTVYNESQGRVKVRLETTARGQNKTIGTFDAINRTWYHSSKHEIPDHVQRQIESKYS